MIRLGRELSLVGAGGAAPTCHARAPRCSGFSGRRARIPGALARELRGTGLLALRHMESSQLRDQTHVAFIGRLILYY